MVTPPPVLPPTTPKGPSTKNYLNTPKHLPQARTPTPRPSTPIPVQNQPVPEVIAAAVRATTLTDEYIEILNKSLKELLKELKDNNFLAHSIYTITVLTTRRK